MSDLRQAAQKVVDAWGDPLGMKRLCEEIEALRAALEKTEPRREWQGLTDADFDWICDSYSTLQGVGRAIEAALKEKNHE
jgi:hypothetical protein